MNNAQRRLMIAAVALTAVATLAQAPAIKRKLLQKESVTAEREAVLGEAEIPGGGQSGRHTHPGVEVGYVLQGPIILEIEGEAPKTLQTGESFKIPYGKVHNGKAAGNTPVKVLSTYIVEKGKPLASPAS